MAPSREVSGRRGAADRDEGERHWYPRRYARMGTLGRGFRSPKGDQKGSTAPTAAGTSGVSDEYRGGFGDRPGPYRTRAVVIGGGAAHRHLLPQESRAEL